MFFRASSVNPGSGFDSRTAFLVTSRCANVLVVKGLPDGLTEKAIAAAKQIRFQPAQKDGRAVSQYAVIEYSFNIY